MNDMVYIRKNECHRLRTGSKKSIGRNQKMLGLITVVGLFVFTQVADGLIGEELAKGLSGLSIDRSWGEKESELIPELSKSTSTILGIARQHESPGATPLHVTSMPFGTATPVMTDLQSTLHGWKKKMSDLWLPPTKGVSGLEEREEVSRKWDIQLRKLQSFVESLSKLLYQLEAKATTHGMPPGYTKGVRSLTSYIINFIKLSTTLEDRWEVTYELGNKFSRLLGSEISQALRVDELLSDVKTALLDLNPNKLGRMEKGLNLLQQTKNHGEETFIHDNEQVILSTLDFLGGRRMLDQSHIIKFFGDKDVMELLISHLSHRLEPYLTGPLITFWPNLKAELTRHGNVEYLRSSLSVLSDQEWKVLLHGFISQNYPLIFAVEDSPNVVFLKEQDPFWKLAWKFSSSEMLEAVKSSVSSELPKVVAKELAHYIQLKELVTVPGPVSQRQNYLMISQQIYAYHMLDYLFDFGDNDRQLLGDQRYVMRSVMSFLSNILQLLQDSRDETVEALKATQLSIEEVANRRTTIVHRSRFGKPPIHSKNRYSPYGLGKGHRIEEVSFHPALVSLASRLETGDFNRRLALEHGIDSMPLGSSKIILESVRQNLVQFQKDYHSIIKAEQNLKTLMNSKSFRRPMTNRAQKSSMNDDWL